MAYDLAEEKIQTSSVFFCFGEIWLSENRYVLLFHTCPCAFAITTPRCVKTIGRRQKNELKFNF